MKSSTPTLEQLKRAIKLAEQIQNLEAEIAAIFGTKPAPSAATRGAPGKSTGKRPYNFSAATLAKRAASKEKADAKAEGKKKTKKGTMSDAGRAAIVAAQKARWAKKREAETTTDVVATAKGKKGKKA